MTDDIRVVCIRSEDVPIVFSWHMKEWGHLYPKEETDKWRESLALSAFLMSSFPATFVALDGDVPVGCVSLDPSDLPGRPDLRPWICSLYVDEGYRKKGIAKKLMDAAEKEASSILDHEPMYAYTFSPFVKDMLLKRKGWSILERYDFVGCSTYILKLEKA